MGVKTMIRNTEPSERMALASKLLNRYWKNLTVRQVNFLARYTKMHGAAPF